MTVEYIHEHIKKIYIEGKGYGFVATKNISKNSIILIESPSFKIKSYSPTCYDMFELLYNITKSDNFAAKTKFENYMPKSMEEEYRQITIEIKNILANLKLHRTYIYDFLHDNYSVDEIILLCLKYISNAFDFFDDGPVILLTGSTFNHSCSPNIIFGKSVKDKNNPKMIFKTIKDICKGEELCNSYVDIFKNYKTRSMNIKKRYGFVCTCCRCTNDTSKKISDLKKQITDITNDDNLIYNYF